MGYYSCLQFLQAAIAQLTGREYIMKTVNIWHMTLLPERVREWNDSLAKPFIFLRVQPVLQLDGIRLVVGKSECFRFHHTAEQALSICRHYSDLVQNPAINNLSLPQAGAMVVRLSMHHMALSAETTENNTKMHQKARQELTENIPHLFAFAENKGRSDLVENAWHETADFMASWQYERDNKNKSSWAARL